jgi:hypothetical protein
VPQTSYSIYDHGINRPTVRARVAYPSPYADTDHDENVWHCCVSIKQCCHTIRKLIDRHTAMLNADSTDKTNCALWDFVCFRLDVFLLIMTQLFNAAVSVWFYA